MKPYRPHRSLWLLIVVVLFAGLAACGNDDGGGDTSPPDDERSEEDAGTPGETSALTVHAIDIDFEEKELEAPAGTVTFTLVNNGQTLHTLVIEGREDDMKLEVQAEGDEDTASLDLGAGEYTYYCDVPGHRQAGMEGTLTVS